MEKTERRARRILVVEEDESIRTLLSIFLSRDGYEVITAGTGEEGFAFLVKGSFDLVLSDYGPFSPIWLREKIPSSWDFFPCKNEPFPPFTNQIKTGSSKNKKG